MRKSPFEILSAILIDVLFIICTCSLLYMCHVQSKINEDRQEYFDNLDNYMTIKQQYDTTTNYNKIKIWSKLKDAENKIR